MYGKYSNPLKIWDISSMGYSSMHERWVPDLSLGRRGPGARLTRNYLFIFIICIICAVICAVISWLFFRLWIRSIIMAYGSTPYVGMAPKKMAATLKVHKWHARNVDVRLIKGFHEHYRALSSASMSNGTVRCAGEHRWSSRLASR